MPLRRQPAAVQLGVQGQASAGELVGCGGGACPGNFGHGASERTELTPPCSLPASTQAFLGVLQLLQKGNPLSLMQQYGELYRLLATDGYASWLDYLLDQASCATEGVCSQLPAGRKCYSLGRLRQVVASLGCALP